MSLSDIALACYAKDDPTESAIAEAYNTSVNRQWSSHLCVLRLSSVLRLPIKTYLPVPDNYSDTREEIGSLSIMYNCTIFPRLSSSTPSDERIHLFRCALMPVCYLESMKIPESKNHYVALCQPKDASLEIGNIQSFISKPIVSSILLNSSTQVKTTATSSSGVTNTSIATAISSLPSTSSTFPKQKLPSISSGSVKAKTKQLVLDALFQKKRKLDETDDGRPITEEQKYYILCNVLRPPYTYTFPMYEDNGRQLRPIIQAIFLCGRQDIALHEAIEMMLNITCQMTSTLAILYTFLSTV